MQTKSAEMTSFASLLDDSDTAARDKRVSAYRQQMSPNTTGQVGSKVRRRLLPGHFRLHFGVFACLATSVCVVACLLA